MFVRAYLRASIEDQDVRRAKGKLEQFANQHGQHITASYVETENGAKVDRSELRRLLADAQCGDVLLVEAVDRLSRLSQGAWKALRTEIESKGLRIVALDLPTSHKAMEATQSDEFTERILDAVNGMLLDMLAAVARKDYEDRRRRQQEGIEKAKQEGKYQGRPRDVAKRKRVAELLDLGFSVRKVAEIANVSTYTVQSVKRNGA